jgi:phytoene dehydrogenase-like protein
VVGGGHNGLVAAAYLARNGMDTLVCERRETVGGAAVSEHPFGPGYTVTSLSYAVSLLPPDLVRDLRLEQHGYHVYPQGPYFAPRTDGRCLRLPADRAAAGSPASRAAMSSARFSPTAGRTAGGTGSAWGMLSRRSDTLSCHSFVIGPTGESAA